MRPTPLADTAARRCWGNSMCIGGKGGGFAPIPVPGTDPNDPLSRVKAVREVSTAPIKPVVRASNHAFGRDFTGTLLTAGVNTPAARQQKTLLGA